jgi:hypothetical protein
VSPPPPNPSPVSPPPPNPSPVSPPPPPPPGSGDSNLSTSVGFSYPDKTPLRGDDTKATPELLRKSRRSGIFGLPTNY